MFERLDLASARLGRLQHQHNTGAGQAAVLLFQKKSAVRRMPFSMGARRGATQRAPALLARSTSRLVLIISTPPSALQKLKDDRVLCEERHQPTNLLG